MTAPFTQGSLRRRAGMTTLPSCLRQATVSRGGDRALVAAKPVCPPLRSSRLDRSACVSSSHTSASHLRGSPETARTMRRFQVRKWSKPHRGFAKKALAHPLHRGGYGRVIAHPPKRRLRRGKAVWSAARFVCRMTLCACRSSSRKTRHAIFAGALYFTPSVSSAAYAA